MMKTLWVCPLVKALFPNPSLIMRFSFGFSQALLLNACLTGLVTFTPLAGLTQPGQRSLQDQLYQAIGNQDWAQAIRVVDLMIQANPNQASALRQYRQELVQMGQFRPTKPPTSAPVATRSTPPNPSLLGVVQIQRRQNGIPVINVTFNRRRDFEMMVDSGASMTVITRPMASALGITPANIVDYAIFNTANGQVRLPIVFVGSMDVGGLVTQQIPVAVAGPEMSVGLLGQDFLQRFDVSLRRDQIEFHLHP
ncbi:TIGR02281 family clan AA aspartic protease [Synechococcus sp. PCC 6312]|uniref:TIGR02281 family clan AA aspartic protease n=1 Tax=Synechococcus sp. (strain ATCC 27167 / PCC 6312) TaxID=195253 RepID=UPI00029F0643|nr:TIGR02281 family clan AA aspartic protease [Synechococcus sp. PCC 6312]AFY61479.1 clan AA aspartic protease, TIGR02281 family [Synechococcus sp. PCC 6312]